MRLPLLATGTLLLALVLSASTLTPTRYTVQDGSRFWIDGSATTGPYTCAADDVSGQATVDGEAVTADVHIPVSDFDCGLPPMNRDFRNALKNERHPTIRFALREADVLTPPSQDGGWARVRALGTLQLAGATRMVAITAEGRTLSNGQVRLRGEHRLRMSDFGIEPPSGMLGLVRAHDGITVRFDVVAAVH